MVKKALLIFPVICAIAIAVFLALNSAHASNTIELPKTGDVFVEIQGKSMEPTIHDGAFVKCDPETDYKVSDVVAFTNGEYQISHRIIGEFAGKFITKGDGNLIPDFSLVSKDSILCKLML